MYIFASLFFFFWGGGGEINPLTPKSAIWHKTPLHAQYLVNLCEICTTERAWKDLHTEGIEWNPPPIGDLIYCPSNFWNFFPL